MKIKHLALAPLNQVAAGNPPPGVKRIALYSVDEMMQILSENYQKSSGDQTRYAFFNMEDHVVTVRGLKLRTFLHYHTKGDCSCSSPECGVKPAYFALEKARKNKTTHKKNNAHPQTAYLSLYGVTKDGEEVEFTHDHTLARCFGGANSLINTTVMCKTCNGLKSRVESKVHNKTLAVLKKFLDDSTGEISSPKFLLERITKPKKDHGVPGNDYERVDVMSLEEALSHIRDPAKKTLDWGQYRLPVKGLRLETLAKDGVPHCQDPECSVKASHFAVERVKGPHNKEGLGYFLNLYGQDKEQKEVILQHHHTIHAEEDGIPSSLDVITLCRDCKNKRVVHEAEVGQKIIGEMGGMTSEASQHASGNREEKRLRVACTEMSKHYEKTEAEFLEWCNLEGERLSLGSLAPLVNKSLHKIVRSFGLTQAGALFFRRTQRDLFHPLFETSLLKTSHVADALAAGVVSIDKDAPKTQPKIDGTRAVEKYKNHLPVLAHQFGMTMDQFLVFCKHQTMMENLPKVPTRVKRLADDLDIRPDTAQVALRYMGEMLNVGPYAGAKYPHLCSPHQTELKNKLLEGAQAFLFDGQIPGYFRAERRFGVMLEIVTHARAKDLGMTFTEYKEKSKMLGAKKLGEMDLDTRQDILSRLEKPCLSAPALNWLDNKKASPEDLYDVFAFGGEKYGWGALKPDQKDGEQKTEHQLIKNLARDLGSVIISWPPHPSPEVEFVQDVGEPQKNAAIKIAL